MKSSAQLLLLVGLFCAGPGSGMQPCRVPGGCLDEASATMLASLDGVRRSCQEADPFHAKQYQTGAARQEAGENAEFLAKVRAMPIYPDILREVESNLAKMSKEEFLRQCAELLVVPSQD